VRFWFACPGCQRQCEQLYADPEQDIPLFRCRVCHDLVYPVQREPERLTLLRAAQKVRRRLGGNTDMDTPLLSKPRGMHQSTFSRLAMRENELLGSKVEADWEWMEKQVNGLKRLLARR